MKAGRSQREGARALAWRGRFDDRGLTRRQKLSSCETWKECVQGRELSRRCTEEESWSDEQEALLLDARRAEFGSEALPSAAGCWARCQKQPGPPWSPFSSPPQLPISSSGSQPRRETERQHRVCHRGR